MSNPKEGEDEEAEEYFYESLDRILSSSSASSTTVSDEDTQTPTTVPKFPISASNYDIWVSEPLSIQERRKRLLHEMGLSNDPLLSRRDGEFSRSMSYDRRKGKIGEELDSNCFVVRSKSDGETARAAVASTSSNSSTSSSSIHSVDVILVKPHCNSQSNRPPTGRKLEEIRPVNPTKLNVMRVSGDLDNGVLENHSDCNGLVEGFKIKNLDNGMEFVVNGARNDQVREIGSGEQITMKEFEMRVGHSPIVQELLRRQNVEGVDGKKDGVDSVGNGLVLKKKGNWFKSLRNVAGAVSGYNHKERRSSDERDNLSEKGGRRSSSATDDGQDLMFNFNEKVKVRQHGKSSKDLTAVYKNQEIQAHNGSIWSIKFSLDGRFLASAGEDCVIHVWQVIESDYKGEFLVDKMENVHLNSCVGAGGSVDPKLVPSHFEIQSEKKRRGRASVNRKSVSLDHVVLPDCIFGLSEIPVCSLLGHVRDVLDLSWSKSQFLLSSSMDKTVRLWHVDSKSCLKVFSHSDYVTCIQFNPVDDRYFISGSLDSKVRIWNIPVRQVVDWSDIHEMVTAACYTPDGQNALVGSSKGSCLMYNTSENKLQHISQIDLQNKKKKSHLKKITGFQFTPGSPSEVLITSADSRIRVVNGVDLVHKYKGFRNTNSQISASFAANGKFVVCASEDSYVYVWEKEGDSQPSRCKGVNVTQSYEYFPCRNVSVAIPWPGICGIAPNRHSNDDNISAVDQSSSEVHESNGCEESTSLSGCTNGSLHSAVSSLSSSYFFDRLLVTCPEEKFHMPNKKGSPLGNLDASDGVRQDTPAWGMVIVTANLKGEIKIFQNFGLPVQI